MKRWVRAAAALAAAAAAGGILMLYRLGRPLEVRGDPALAGVEETVCRALYDASLAANSHNAQSWRVELDPDRQRLVISADETRALKTVDPLGREQCISLGCYLESLVYAFGAYGYDAAAAYAGADAGSMRAEVTYRRRENAEPDARRIGILRARHTDKSAYRTDPLRAEAVDALLEDNAGVRYYPMGSEGFAFLQSGTLEAVRTQSAQRAYRAELNQWMRFSDAEVLQKKTAFPPKCSA